VKKTAEVEARIAELQRLAENFYLKSEEEKVKFTPKIDPNHAFLVKKNTERIKLSLADLTSPASKLMKKKGKVIAVRILDNDDIPF